MGNIVSDPNDYNLYAGTELKKVIEKWAVNKYDAGLSWGKIDIHGTPIKINNLLKKRACCTRQKIMNIALPTVDLNVYGPNSIKDGYTVFKVRVFEDNDFKDPKTCLFIDESLPNDKSLVSYYQDTLIGNAGANPKCKSLYERGGVNLALCEKIKAERISNYGGRPAQSAYGYYATNTKVLKDNSLDSYNNYTDCNCQNSILRDIRLPKLLGFDNLNSLETFVQSNDAYCSKCGGEGTCFISSLQRVNSLCINISEVQNALIENASNLQNIQTCSLQNTVGDSTYTDPALAASWASSYIMPTTQAPQAAKSGLLNQTSGAISQLSADNKKIIIIISVFIGILIIIIIGVVIYKKRQASRNEYSEQYYPPPPSPQLYLNSDGQNTEYGDYTEV